MANRNPNKKGLMPAWKPGQSGNPSGRPRRKPVSERYAFMCEVPLPEKIRKKLHLQVGATYGDGLSLAQFHAALDGDTTAAREIREAIEGKSAIRTEEEVAPVRIDISGIPMSHERVS